MVLVDMTLPILTAPTPPDPTAVVEMEIWKLDIKGHRKKTEGQATQQCEGVHVNVGAMFINHMR